MYDSFSADYDRFVNWQSRLAGEMPFLLQQLRGLSLPGKAAPLRVLDAACGTGMHAIALAKAGFSVAGADLSAGMIEKSRQNAQAAGVEVRFETVGFGGLAKVFGAGSFEALLCLGNSLPHLLTPADLSAALADFAACLTPGGKLLVQNRNFDAVLSRRERWMESQSYLEAEKEWIFLRFYDYHPDGLLGFNILTLYREGQAAWNQSVAETLLYPLQQAELAQALPAAGFEEIAWYGNLAGSSFDLQGSGNLVFVALKHS
jgi:ubiquinone/menaquinone biosynthesis C-methylase UbiE